MTAPFNINMNAVTRLTKVGRLAEATALLRRILSGAAGRESPPTGGSDEPPMIDMAPPSAQGDAWTATAFTTPANVPPT